MITLHPEDRPPPLKDLVDSYVDLIESGPNQGDQHVHPEHGASHLMIRMMCDLYGQTETQRAITLEMNARLRRRKGLPPL